MGGGKSEKEEKRMRRIDLSYSERTKEDVGAPEKQEGNGGRECERIDFA